MSTYGDILALLILILINGLLAMAEIAMVSASTARLQNQANQGHQGARIALDFANQPNQYLATIQIGISLVAILTGAFGGASFGDELASQIARVDLLEPYSQVLGFGVVVVAITYASLLLGELVPKRIGLSNPEGVAILVARPMRGLTMLTYPAVRLLSVSTSTIIRLLRINLDSAPPISEDEIRLMVAEGTRAGVFDPAEQILLHQILELDDQNVDVLMTPRPKMVWLGVDANLETLNQKMRDSGYSYFPVYRHQPDNILGMVSAKAVWGQVVSGQSINWDDLIKEPLFIPENTTALQALTVFRDAERRVALVIDEYGTIQGLLSVSDIVQHIVGDIMPDHDDTPHIMQRADGSWLVDGMFLLDDLEDQFSLSELPQEEKNDYQTVGGFIMARLDRVPHEGDIVESNGLRFEVVDMDGNRVDKVLLIQVKDH